MVTNSGLESCEIHTATYCLPVCTGYEKNSIATSLLDRFFCTSIHSIDVKSVKSTNSQPLSMSLLRNSLRSFKAVKYSSFLCKVLIWVFISEIESFKAIILLSFVELMVWYNFLVEFNRSPFLNNLV